MSSAIKNLHLWLSCRSEILAQPLFCQKYWQPVVLQNCYTLPKEVKSGVGRERNFGDSKSGITRSDSWLKRYTNIMRCEVHLKVLPIVSSFTSWLEVVSPWVCMIKMYDSNCSIFWDIAIQSLKYEDAMYDMHDSKMMGDSTQYIIVYNC